ncbi:MAG: DUF6155 family protein [Bacteroidota bacterium]
MGLKEIKQELLKQDKEILVKHILELYKKYDFAKEYFDFYVTPDEEKILEKYKEKVREGFFPKRGMRLKLSLSRKAINDFRRLETSKEKLGDLMLYYVECGVKFTNNFGDISESFYTSAENTFEKSLSYFAKEGVLDKYKERAEQILKNTADSGWGFGDTIEDIYYNYYE